MRWVLNETWADNDPVCFFSSRVISYIWLTFVNMVCKYLPIEVGFHKYHFCPVAFWTFCPQSGHIQNSAINHRWTQYGCIMNILWQSCGITYRLFGYIICVLCNCAHQITIKNTATINTNTNTTSNTYISVVHCTFLWHLPSAIIFCVEGWIIIVTIDTCMWNGKYMFIHLFMDHPSVWPSQYDILSLGEFRSTYQQPTGKSHLHMIFTLSPHNQVHIDVGTIFISNCKH